MANDLQIFNNPEFGEIRRIEINGESWWIGMDIATALGYANQRNAIARHVDSEDARKQGVLAADGKTYPTTVINESGVYALIIGSNIPKARKFKRWFTKEVLPSIMRTGTYIHDRPALTTNELVLQSIEQMKLLAQNSVELERRVNQIEAKTDATIQLFTTTAPAENWRGEMERQLKELCDNGERNPRDVLRGRIYKDVEHIAGVRLGDRLKKLHTRLKKNNGASYRDYMKYTKLDIISRDKKLITAAFRAVQNYVSTACIALGLLQVSCLMFADEINASPLRWLRTKSNAIPSEASTADYLRKIIFKRFPFSSNFDLIRFIKQLQRVPVDSHDFDTA